MKAIVCLGIDNQKIIDFFQDKTELIYSTSSMEEAVKVSKSLVEKREYGFTFPMLRKFRFVQ